MSIQGNVNQGINMARILYQFSPAGEDYLRGKQDIKGLQRTSNKLEEKYKGSKIAGEGVDKKIGDMRENLKKAKFNRSFSSAKESLSISGLNQKYWFGLNQYTKT